jgi:hypothetical protein
LAIGLVGLGIGLLRVNVKKAEWPDVAQ